MTVTHEEARDDLLAVLEAARELSQDHDVQLAEGFLNRLNNWSSDLQAVPLDRDESSANAARASRWVELTSGILSGIAGVTALVYVVNAINRADLVNGLTAPSRVMGQATIETATQALMLMVIPLLGVALGPYLHTIFKAHAGLLVLWVSSAIAVAASTVTTMTAAFSLPKILYILRYTQGVAPTNFTILQVVAAVLAVVACGASLAPQGGFGRPVLADRRRVACPRR